MRTLISNPDAYNDPPRPFFEHIVALRGCVIGSFTAWACCVVVAGVFSPHILAWIKAPAASSEGMLQGLDLTSGFNTIMSIALWGGTALSFPFVTFFLFRFIFPALTKREKALILFYLLAGSGCFGVGVWMAYAQTLPVVVTVFQQINKWVGLSVATVRIEGYISIVLKTIIAFGLAFQLPLIVFMLGWIGVISSATLRKYRRLAIVIIFFLGMVLTPPDPMSQILMAVPMCILYELCIWVIRLKEIASGRDVGEKKAEGEKKEGA